jgi:hypothetical protein
LVDSSCRPGSEETGGAITAARAGTLRVNGQNVGDIMTAENLAHPLTCEPAQ